MTPLFFIFPGAYALVVVLVVSLCKAAARGDRMARNGWRNRGTR